VSKGGSTTQTATVDPRTQQYVDLMRQYALGAAGITNTYGGQGSDAALGGGGSNFGGAFGPFFGGGGGTGGPGFLAGQRGGAGAPSGFTMPPLPPGIAQAQQQYQNYATGGNLGFSALTGNADAAQQFLNPYTQTMNPFFAQQRALAVQGANDQATQLGAFGGDRSQIGAAVAGSQADQNQAGFQYQAFNDAMQRALQAANLGYGASAQAAFLPQEYYGGQLGLLGAGVGPYGQSQTQQTQSDPFSQLLGLGLTFGPMAFGAPPASAPTSGAYPMMPLI